MGSLLAEEVLRAVASCRPVRRFSAVGVTRQEIVELLHAVNNMPSSFNLQPWQFIVVDDPTVKKRLSLVAMSQPHIQEAPVTVIFYVDPRWWKAPYRRLLDLNVQRGVISPQQAKGLRRNVDFQMNTGRFGLLGFLKRLALPIARLRSAMPNVFGSVHEVGQYLCSQAMFAAAAFVVAAKASGYDTCPTDLFDEERVKNLLKMPRRMRVAMMISVGYALSGYITTDSVPYPLEEKLGYNSFPAVKKEKK